MSDDIDDLLNEVESKFCTKETNRKPKETSKAATHKRSDDLDDLINEIFDDENHETIEVKGGSKKVSVTTSSTSLHRAPSNSQQSKCFQVFLGGSSTERGLATAVNQRACDRLRCTDCDFLVSSFDNLRWHSSTDYLFLRNNMPDLHRLKPKLTTKKGYRAYACQCKWRSVKEFVNLQNEVDLKWVCGKH